MSGKDSDANVLQMNGFRSIANEFSGHRHALSPAANGASFVSLCAPRFKVSARVNGLREPRMKREQTPSEPETEPRRNQFTRRQLLTTTAGVAVTASLYARTGLAYPNAVSRLTSHAPTSPDSSSDGLAIPFHSKSFGTGKERAIVLGGGGEYWVAWMLGYLRALETSGANVERADAFIGTSAGSLVGSAVSGGQMARLTREFDFFGDFPKLLARVIPTTQPNSSQLRTKQVAEACTSSDVATIQQLGRAAMASRNFDVTKLEDMILKIRKRAGSAA